MVRKAQWGVPEDFVLVIRYTRHWIHYGFLAHVTICTLIAAVEGLLGR